MTKKPEVVVPGAGELYYAEDGTVSMVLDDTHDPNYRPSTEELHEYAQWLGMDPELDKELMWVAEEGLKAPLPKDWRPCKTDSGEIYYFNFRSGESIWDHPMDEFYKAKFQEEKEKLARSKKGGGGGGSGGASMSHRYLAHL
eukprot:PhF_6_TR10099/c0_g1_i1/m.15715